ncbi:MAG: transglycosylase domain-containing protein, partial [Proteobacteria bacterium]|nr:transglycosylase domain-containing protein [Pseudomonadota bacterium]
MFLLKMINSATVIRCLWLAIRLILWLGFVTSLILTVVTILLVHYSDDSELAKTTILAKMEEETSIYYLDGQERIGSLFSGIHRRYVPLRNVPAHMQNAIIAAEDKNFYLHRGVDFGAVLKAFYDGLISGGKFRRGGS